MCVLRTSILACRSAPSGPSLSLVRYPPRFAQGTNRRLFPGSGSRIRDEVRVVQRPPFSLRSAGPPRLTSRPPEGGCSQALSWLLWFAFMAMVVVGSKKRTRTCQWSTVSPLFASAASTMGGSDEAQRGAGGRARSARMDTRKIRASANTTSLHAVARSNSARKVFKGVRERGDFHLADEERA